MWARSWAPPPPHTPGPTRATDLAHLPGGLRRSTLDVAWFCSRLVLQSLILQSSSDVRGRRRVHRIFERAVRAFKGDLELWHAAIEFAIKHKAHDVASKRLGEAVKLSSQFLRPRLVQQQQQQRQQQQWPMMPDYKTSSTQQHKHKLLIPCNLIVLHQSTSAVSVAAGRSSLSPVGCLLLLWRAGGAVIDSVRQPVAAAAPVDRRAK
jgi:hypothetical protein